MKQLRDYDIHTLQQEGIRKAPDAIVWKRCQMEGRVLITSNGKDFPPRDHPADVSHHGVLWIKDGNLGRQKQIEVLRQAFDKCGALADDYFNQVIIIEAMK